MICPSKRPRNKLAAVLVLLYEQAGELRVLLTTRSKALRTHAGQTALPGGKADDGDVSFVDTAFREAHEEVSLPLCSPDIYTLTFLEPFISLYRIVVTPVIAVLTRPVLLEELKPAEDEVACIFTHPLRAILDPGLARAERLVAIGEDWPYETELYSTTDSIVPILNDTVYRMHRFQSSASPIKGLTADILIKVAEVAYGETTVYGRYAPGQLEGFAAMSRVIDELQA
ncbi:NUDIX hydrolase domain-like protein [Collybia nuda]|uniref:NUDIX hydrolase domain-like protein n=1 Tax=Collybia nuda TaxID=64659 RepID=A0A9P5Y722_9AGAR|nr:NUDIX hydrolase domain-like protein [Collybia nuda]